VYLLTEKVRNAAVMNTYQVHERRTKRIHAVGAVKQMNYKLAHLTALPSILVANQGHPPEESQLRLA